MQEEQAIRIKKQPRFGGIFENCNGFNRRIHLTSHMLYECNRQFQKAVQRNLDGSAIRELEARISSYINVPEAIAMNSGTSAMHMAYKLAARRAYRADSLEGKRVFCPDLCQIEQAMPILYLGGIPTFIDVDDFCYSMDPESLENAFSIYPDTKIVVMNHLYGFPGRITEIKKICEEHGAILIENASESFGAKVDGKYTGSIGDMAVLDFGQDKIITGGTGGILVTKDYSDSQTVRQWINMSLRNLPWQHSDSIGYDYMMNDLSAAMILGQLDYIDEIIASKKQIYENYLDNLNEEIIYLIRAESDIIPNYWMPYIICDSPIEAAEERSKYGYSYRDIHGTSSPMEIVDALDAFGVDAVPVYMPMSKQTVFSGCELITPDEVIEDSAGYEESKTLFAKGMGRNASRRGVCLPSDMSMTEDEQKTVIEIIQCCFDKAEIDRKAFMAVV
ncbi:MAG: DegT/DnrJ/EryC1/StrS family aminotransferase [Butyrivibrio sp.]|nr:DegT/DnrJ/EryC1/StrS family aminotransferase [Butyrivibrio sp.]MBP3197895.1 DegT/DnrJ/EryC1/StrS family aminotransferase [Butyrivibrio sp.]